MTDTKAEPMDRRDLGEPYGSEDERADARETLLRYWYAIGLLTKLALQPANEWSPMQAGAFPASAESPAHRLQRWSGIYGDEIGVIRMVHGDWFAADSNLRAAIYLARNVVTAAMGVPLGEAESAVRKVRWLFSGEAAG